MFESSKEENLLMNKKITNQIEEIDRLQQENKSLKVKLGSRVVRGPNQAVPTGHTVCGMVQGNTHIALHNCGL